MTLLRDIVMSGRLKLDPARNDFPVTLHDPCNMVRLMGIVEPQREIVRAICPRFREMAPHGVDNYCCGGGSGFAIMSGHNFADWRFQVAGRKKLDQVLGAFADCLEPSTPKYLCAPVQQLQGPVQGHAGVLRICGSSNRILYGGLAELIVNAMAGRQARVHRMGVALIAMDVQLLGINHHTAPLELRERLALDGAGVAAVLREIRGDAAVAEAVLLATCNRTELYVARRRFRGGRGGHAAALRTPGRRPRARSSRRTPTRETGERAARHLLRVAAGLDSMILGEHQILGQVREAQSRAQEAETLGPLTHRLWSTALHAGKRARAETDIGMGAVSVAQAAVCLAERCSANCAAGSVL